VPAVVFTSPEVASVGTTELEYMDEHGTCSCRTVQMEDVPRAKAVKNTDGLVQVVKHHETDERIAGVHMVGPRAADMIGGSDTGREVRPDRRRHHRHRPPVPNIPGSVQTRLSGVPPRHVDDELLCRVDNRELGAPLAVSGDCRAAEAEQEHQSNTMTIRTRDKQQSMETERTSECDRPPGSY